MVNAFRSRSNLSNELMDCTFVYNDTDVFYNCGIRFRGSPFLRSGTNWSPYDNHSYRIEFNPDQSYRGRTEINLDNTEGSLARPPPGTGLLLVLRATWVSSTRRRNGSC